MGVASTVEVVDHTGLRVAQDPIANLVRAVLEAEGVAGNVVVAFVDEAAITGLNARFRDVTEPTDVLSFCYADGEGEVVVCPAVVRRYAEEDGADPGNRLAWTVLHGTLHLLGYDHERDRGEMRQRERELLEKLDPSVAAVSYP